MTPLLPSQTHVRLGGFTSLTSSGVDGCGYLFPSLPQLSRFPPPRRSPPMVISLIIRVEGVE